MADNTGNTASTGSSGTNDQPTQTGPTYERPGEGLDEYVSDDGTLRPNEAKAMAEEAAQRPKVGDGGFKLDLDAMRALLPEWEELRDLFDELRNNGGDLAEVRKPAEDYASEGQIRAAGDHQQRYYRIIEQQYKYVEEYTAALRKAIEKHEQTEQTQRENVRKIGDSI